MCGTPQAAALQFLFAIGLFLARPASVLAATPDAVVAADGSGQYKTVQAAISAAADRRPGEPRFVIFVKDGTYKERIYVQRERGYITLIGESQDKTIITYDLNANLPGPDALPIGTLRTPTFQVDGDGFQVENLTLAYSAGPVGQALALRVDGDKVSFKNCKFLGWQDPILLNRRRQYFENCTIEGHVDFIFGGATAYLWISSPDWPRWCHAHGSISPDTTGCWRRTTAGAPR